MLIQLVGGGWPGMMMRFEVIVLIEITQQQWNISNLKLLLLMLFSSFLQLITYLLRVR